MQLSENFSFEEMTTTEHRDLLDQNRKEAEYFTPELARLAREVLEPIRALVGGPVVVHSGFRSNALNQAVGGSTTSQHSYGEAADTVYPGRSLTEIYNLIMASNIPFGQLIFEFGEWVHVSCQDPGRYPGKVRQCLRADRVNGATVYSSVTAPLA